MQYHRIARDMYHRVRNPDLLAERREARRFYGNLVARGELAFDVGACRGDVSEALSYCGVHVVAVEPNPELARRLRRLHIASAVEAVAIGAAPGRAQLRLGLDAGHSTLSSEWVDLIGSDRFGSEVEVDVTTLDELIGRYGEPAYIKIDVEGYEPEVLAGLARAQ
jgi:FkbM family methyltransferase